MPKLSREEEIFAMMRITEMLQIRTDEGTAQDHRELLAAVYYLGREDEKNAKNPDHL